MLLDHFLPAVPHPPALEDSAASVAVEDAIAGLDAVVASLKELVLWPVLRHDEFLRLGVQPPTGVLLHGPPGVGKTAVTRAVVTQASTVTACKLITLDAAEVRVATRAFPSPSAPYSMYVAADPDVHRGRE